MSNIILMPVKADNDDLVVEIWINLGIYLVTVFEHGHEQRCVQRSKDYATARWAAEMECKQTGALLVDKTVGVPPGSDTPFFVRSKPDVDASRQPIVVIRDGEVFANSRDVAAFFGKRHDAVLRDVSNLLGYEPDLGLHNFVEGSYSLAETGAQQHRCFEMDRDGFALLAMGFTGQSPQATKSPQRDHPEDSMNAFVPIEPGQWILAYYDHCFNDDRDLAGNLEKLRYRGAGWDSYRAEDIFLVHRAERVSPKTYIVEPGRRFHRSYVIAAAATEGEITALRDKLFAIGRDVDDAIEAEQARLIEAFAAQARSAALTKIHAALPHIFGKSA